MGNTVIKIQNGISQYYSFLLYWSVDQINAAFMVSIEYIYIYIYIYDTEWFDFFQT